MHASRSAALGAPAATQAPNRSAPPSGSFVVQCFVSPNVAVEAAALSLGSMRLVRLTASSTTTDLLRQLRVVNLNDPQITVRAAKGDGTAHASLNAYRSDMPLWGQDGFVFPFLVKVAHSSDAPPHEETPSFPVVDAGKGTRRGEKPEEDPLDLSGGSELDERSSEPTSPIVQRSSNPATTTTMPAPMSVTPMTDMSLTQGGSLSLPPSSPTAYRRQKRIRREEERRRRDQLIAKRADAVALIEEQQRSTNAQAKEHAAAREAVRRAALEEELRQNALRDEQQLVRRKVVLEKKRELMSERETFVANVNEDFNKTMRAALFRAQLSSPFTAPRTSPPSLAAVKQALPPSQMGGFKNDPSSRPASVMNSRNATEALSPSPSGAFASSMRATSGTGMSPALETILQDLHAKMQKDTEDAEALQRENMNDARRAAEQAYLDHVAERMHARKVAANRENRAKSAALAHAEFAVTSVVFTKPNPTANKSNKP